MTTNDPSTLPTTLAELRESGWRSRPVKDELRENLVRALERAVLGDYVAGRRQTLGQAV